MLSVDSYFFLKKKKGKKSLSRFEKYADTCAREA